MQAHPYCFLANAAVTASDNDGLPRLVGYVLGIPSWLRRKELAVGPNALFCHIAELRSRWD